MSSFFKSKISGATNDEKKQFMNLSSQETDIDGDSENQRQTVANQPNQSSGGIGDKLTKAKNFVLGRKEPEPQGWLSIFNCLGNSKNYLHAGISFGIAFLFGFLTLLMLSTLIVAPSKFVLCFTLTIVSLIAGTASLSGPRVYVKNMFRDKNLIASIILITCIIFSLYFSMIQKSYLMSLLMCIIELNAVLYFFCNTTACKLSTFKSMLTGICMMLKGLISRAG